jgi:hypothetical protein
MLRFFDLAQDRQAQHERKIFNHFKLLTVRSFDFAQDRPEVLEG